MDGEVPFTNLLRCNHHWPFCHAPTPTRHTLTNLTLIPIIMRILTILFPGHPGAARKLAIGSAAGYRLGSDRGSPNQGSTPLSKRVRAQIRSPVRVRTYRPVPWRMPVGARM